MAVQTATVTTPDPDLVRLVVAGTPFAETLGPEVVDLAPEQAVLRLDAPVALHNHVGGPHAAALFGLAETAAAATVLLRFTDLLEQGCVPLIKGAQIDYRAIATGPVTATARFVGDEAGVRASVAARGVAVFPVEITLTTEDGTTAATMRADMALKRLG
jgi:acyl-coenzyme A thioesterase PaaI-like protein